jgi:hypothetical protein
MRTPHRLVGIMAEPNQQLGRLDKIGKDDRRGFGADHRMRLSAEHDTQFSSFCRSVANCKVLGAPKVAPRFYLISPEISPRISLNFLAMVQTGGTLS